MNGPNEINVNDDVKNVDIVKKIVKKPFVPKKKLKQPRTLSKYNLFCKEQFQTEAIKSLPVRERFKAISLLWKEEKEKK